MRTAVVFLAVLAACGSTESGPPSGAGTSVPGIEDVTCPANASCAAGFTVEGRLHSLSCGAVRPDRVTDEVLARGRYQGQETEVRRIRDVDRDVLVAVRLPGGLCGDDDMVALSPWSMAFIGRHDDEVTKKAVCAAAVEQHLERNHCPR